ncbi:MAG: HAD family phosphatase [Candidatus Tenebribacter davisii]|jgi:FMN phosphatase YigB (HAD superfamily)|nr:HAD family phosphatase [Candidatus Tenebribacter davisii]
MKNIIFDLGKVLVEYNFDILFKELDAYPTKEMRLETIATVREFDSGNISRYEFYKRLKEIYNFKHSAASFEKLWCSVFTGLTSLVDYARELKNDYDVFILSNTDEIHFPSIWHNFPELHFFEDNLMLSYKLASVKPQKEIYERALKLFDLNPEDCLLIDDKFENLHGAEQIGITGILYTDAEETKIKIKKMLN